MQVLSLTPITPFLIGPLRVPEDTQLGINCLIQNDLKDVRVGRTENLEHGIRAGTGYRDTNTWVEWITYTVQSLGKTVTLIQ